MKKIKFLKFVNANLFALSTCCFLAPAINNNQSKVVEQSYPSDFADIYVTSYTIQNEVDGQFLITPIGVNPSDTIVFKTKDPFQPHENGGKDIVISEWNVASDTMYAFRFDEIIKYNDVNVTLGGVGSSGFKDCTNLRSLIFGSGVKFFVFNAFVGCTNLKNIYFDYKDNEIVTVTVRELNIASTDPALTFFFASGPSANSIIPDHINFNNAVKTRSNELSGNFATSTGVPNKIYTGPGLKDLEIRSYNTTIDFSNTLDKSVLVGYIGMTKDAIHPEYAPLDWQYFSLEQNASLKDKINPWFLKTSFYQSAMSVDNDGLPTLPFGIRWNDAPTSEEVNLAPNLFVTTKYQYEIPSSDRILEVACSNEESNPITTKLIPKQNSINTTIIIAASSAGGVVVLSIIIGIIVAIKRRK